MPRQQNNHMQHTIKERESRALARGESPVFLGVCSGIADHFNADAIVVRVSALVLACCTAGLIVVPYVALGVYLPKATPSKKPLDVNPVDAKSERYERMVHSPRDFHARARQMHAARMGAAHRPPAPPFGAASSKAGQGSDVHGEEVNTRWHRFRARAGQAATRHDKALIVLVLTVALCVLFMVPVGAAVTQIPGTTVWGFWPIVFIVAGTVALVCFAEQLPLAVRLCGLVFCVEVCVVMLPLTLGICPPSSVERISPLPFLLGIIAVLMIVVSHALRRPPLFALAVLLLAIAVVICFLDISLLSRIEAMSGLAQHRLVLA